jgi:hypothetical protein
MPFSSVPTPAGAVPSLKVPSPSFHQSWLSPKVRRHGDVLPAVAVEVHEGRRPAEAARHETRRERRVLEVAGLDGAEVAQQAGMVEAAARPPLAREDVEPNVAVVVAEGHAVAAAVRARRDLGAPRHSLLGEVPRPVVDVEMKAAVRGIARQPQRGDVEVGVAVVVDVREARAVRLEVGAGQPGRERHVLEAAIAAIAEEKVGGVETAHVEIGPAVAVHVRRGRAARHPLDLAAEGRGIAQADLGIARVVLDVGEPGGCGDVAEGRLRLGAHKHGHDDPGEGEGAAPHRRILSPRLWRPGFRPQPPKAWFCHHVRPHTAWTR